MIEPPAIVVMGVSGSGKTSVGQALAQRLGVPFMDGDDFHPPSNVEKMAAGIPLTDDDRWPWLDHLGAEMAERANRQGGVVAAASALRRVYRQHLMTASDLDITFAHLDGSAEIIAARMADRKGHYMPASLLESQIATLEPPGEDEEAITLPIDIPVDQIVDMIVSKLPG